MSLLDFLKKCLNIQQLPKFQEEFLKTMEDSLVHGTGRMTISNLRTGRGMLENDRAFFWNEYMKSESDFRQHRKCIYCNNDCQLVRGISLWPQREDLAKAQFLVFWECSAHVSMNDNG